MNVEDCFQAGFIARAHGIKGEIRAAFDVDDIKDYQNKALIFLQFEGKLTPYHVEYIRLVSHREALIKFKNVANRNQAEEIAGAPFFLPLSDLPALSGKKFYYHEIVGFQVKDKVLGELGKIRGVREMPGQDILVMVHEGYEILIPITDAIVIQADREQKVLETHLPEGLMEIYMNPPGSP